MKKLKVYAGVTYVHLSERRTIVAATSKAQAINHLRAHGDWISSYDFNKNWRVTENSVEVFFAMSRPGTVFRTLTNGEFHEVEK